jgi:integrase
MVSPVREFLLSLQTASVSNHLFPNSADLSRPLKSVKKPWDWIRQRAGIPTFRIHDIRHTIGSNMAMHADIATIASVLGHADRRTTERYVHAQSDNVRNHLTRAADSNATILLGKPNDAHKKGDSDHD